MLGNRWLMKKKKLLICTGEGPPLAKKPKAENDLKEQISSIVNSKTVYGLPSTVDGDAVKENREKLPQPGCSKDFYQLDTDNDYFSFDNENEVIVVETSTPRKGILVNTEPQNNKYQKNESCQKFAATTNEDSVIMVKSVLNFCRKNQARIFKTKKDDLHVDGCSAWSSRRKPAMKETGGADLKKEYSSLAKAKFELYSEELKLAKSRIKREEEIHELNKESLNLEIEKKQLGVKRLQAFVVE
ncbi:unnamed protein product [Ceutorhynchus assimilis]|uniref:Uncharacterized protein n=1 Tax=Ceutorhynchus assimilis TaxID=467358 RepID=A0A9N9N242_9CUCU|nr:unnamed protein product [Ceutorhynchus assimilis]